MKRKSPICDIPVTEQFLEEHQELIMYLGGLVAMQSLYRRRGGGLRCAGSAGGWSQTYRTLQSGVYYESVPNNPFAAAIYKAVQDGMSRRLAKGIAGIWND